MFTSIYDNLYHTVLRYAGVAELNIRAQTCKLCTLLRQHYITVVSAKLTLCIIPDCPVNIQTVCHFSNSLSLYSRDNHLVLPRMMFAFGTTHQSVRNPITYHEPQASINLSL